MSAEIQFKLQKLPTVMCELWVTKGFMIELRHKPPNWFHRKMQEWIFGFRYVLKKK